MLNAGFRSKTGLFWFTNDLRLHDNGALARAAAETEQLLCVYIVDPAWFKPNRFGISAIGVQRWRFLSQSLADLRQHLAALGQDLITLYANPCDAIARLITVCNADAIYRSQNAGYYEQADWQTLQSRYPAIGFTEIPTHTLFSAHDLPFNLQDLPETFSRFRKRVESTELRREVTDISALPPPPAGINLVSDSLPPAACDNASPFQGGASRGIAQLDDYFSSALPGNYKAVRNELDGWQHSTKLSPWLANGSLSARRVVKSVYDYEARRGGNDSTRHIVFELLWREYFQWYAHAHGHRLFAFSGIKRKKLLTSFYPERFKRWSEGSTPYPLVNACMKHLNATGYMSNRGRQVVASCLVNELALDWRVGAAYFEKHLIDYDVASNWGNWQYLAGVGADPREQRHFNIDKQASQYDPDGDYVRRWQGLTTAGPMDSVDAADWPVA